MMAKIISRYKGKVYINEANYSARLLMVDVWKDTGGYRVGDIFRIIHKGKKIPNRIHLERVPIQDSISVGRIWMYKNSKFEGSYVWSVPVESLINFIEKTFGYEKFNSRPFTIGLAKSQQIEIKKIMNNIEVEKYKRIFEGGEALNRLCNRGYMEKIYEDEKVFYRLLENPIVDMALHHLDKNKHNDLYRRQE